MTKLHLLIYYINIQNVLSRQLYNRLQIVNRSYNGTDKWTALESQQNSHWHKLKQIMYLTECTFHTHTCTHPFNGPLSGTIQVSRYQKGKTNLGFTEARDSEWQWNQLGHMQVCTPSLSFLQAG